MHPQTDGPPIEDLLRSRKARARYAGTLCLPVSLALSFFVLLTPALAHAEARTVRVGIYENEPKIFTATTENGRPSGIFVDLIEEIAKDEGWKLIYVPGTFEEGLESLEAGRIDLMPDVAYSAARDRKYGFHKTPVVDSWSYVYAAPGVRVDRISQLDGKRVAVLRGSIQETVFTQMVEGFGYDITIVPVDSLKEAFGLARDGKVDAAIANYLFGDYFYLRYGLVKTPIVFNAVPLFYATAEGRNADLLAAVDRHLSRWIKEPGSVYYRTLSRYTAQAPEPLLPTWVLWAIGTAAGLLLITTGLVVLLRWTVAARTRQLARSTEALREAEERLQLALDASGQGTWDWFPKTGEVVWTSGSYALLGYKPHEFPMSLDVWRALAHPDDVDSTLGTVNASIESGNHTFRIEYRLRTKSGGWMWTVSRGKAVLFDEQGRPERVVGTNEDITARHEAEAELERYRGHLEDLVEHRTRALEAANAELAEANRKLAEATQAKSRFFANMSHELRTPLNSIIGFSGILVGGMAGELTEEQSRQIGMIRTAGDRLLALLNDVLDLSKIEAGSARVDARMFDAAGLVADVSAMAQPLAADKGIAMRVHTPGHEVLVESDEGKLRQILTNLVGNAVKFTDSGEVSIRLEPGDRGPVVFTVADTGRGISEEDVAHIFEAFRQAASARSDQPQGTGLGLAISQEFARLLGGSITVTSELGKGSVFTLTLPARRA